MIIFSVILALLAVFGAPLFAVIAGSAIMGFAFFDFDENHIAVFARNQIDFTRFRSPTSGGYFVTSLGIMMCNGVFSSKTAVIRYRPTHLLRSISKANW